jgi:glucose/arabinose dehydrogenase
MFIARRFFVMLALALACVMLLASACDDINDDTPDPTPTPASEEVESDSTPALDDDSAADDAAQEDGDQSGTGDDPEWVNFEVEVLAAHLDIPWEMVFLPNGDMFITERPGQVRLFRDGELQDDPILEFDDVVHERGAEGGLLGMVLHPDFEETNWIYFYYTYGDGDEWRNRVVRYEVDGTDFSDRTIIVDDMPGAYTHNGGRMKFGPDGKLYVTLGDAQIQDQAQNPDVLAAKLLRLNDDGTFPDDNPYDDSPVYAIGLRNPQGLSWHPETGELYTNQHGPTGNDEINRIEPGANYGWPDMEGFEGEQKDEFTLPVMASGQDTWAPSGSTFYDGDHFPQWRNHYLMAGLRSVTLYNIDFSTDPPEMHPIIQGIYGRFRTVVQGPDGYIYLLTSNRDERQEPADDDDKLLRLVPADQAAG